MANIKELMEELDGLTAMVEQASVEKPTPAAPESDQAAVQHAEADLTTIEKRLKDELSAIEEIIATAEKATPLKRLIWLSWGSVQSLQTCLEGIATELEKQGRSLEKDPTAAVRAVEDLKRVLHPVVDAIDHLNSISKV